MPMKIALDLRRIKNPGIGRYMRCLTEAMAAQNSGNDFLLILPPDVQQPAATLGPRATKIHCSAKYYSIREQMELPRILRSHKVDLLHSPHFVLPLMKTCPAVVTIHDVIYLACKEDLPSKLGRAYYRAMITTAACRADRVITVSEFSKADIVQRLGTDPEKIEVIYSGVSPGFARGTDRLSLEQVRDKYSIRGKFILYAGIYKPRKNHAALFRAFQKLPAHLGAELVIAGPLDEGELELRRLTESLGIVERVRFTGFVEDSELACLYSAATVYACPSLYEGFGLTVLEAMSCGAPVVCSRETSLPEVAGRAALFADPRSSEDFAAALYRAFCDADLRRELVHRGYENCRRFRWDQAAAQTLAVYERTGRKPTPEKIYA
jgi:glycosyltransferase involved in cell wall biosynthesis